MSGSSSKFWVYFLRILTVICGLALIFLGVYSLVHFSYSGIRDLFLQVYYILFGIITCLLEMPCDSVMGWFVFLKFNFGKGLFFLFLGSITFMWSNFYFLVISIVLFCAGITFLILSFTSDDDYKGFADEKSKPDDHKKYEEV